MLVNVRKMAAEGGGVWGGSKKGNRKAVTVGLTWAGARDENARELTQNPAETYTRPPRLPPISRPRRLRLRKAAITHAE